MRFCQFVISPFRKRVLKLQLTDGHQTVTAMEYRPVPMLHTKLTPGCKCLILGPVRCVNKVLMLESKNVKLLGGEVAKYVVENAFENVLLRQLNRPLNPNPKTEYAGRFLRSYFLLHLKLAACRSHRQRTTRSQLSTIN